MKGQKRFLAFDIGAESGRAIAGTLDNNRLSLNEIHRFANGGVQVNNHLHWDVLGLYSQLLTGLKKYAKEYGSSLHGIGVDTWGVGIKAHKKLTKAH